MRLREFTDKSYWHGTTIPGLTSLIPRQSDLVGKRVVFAATYPEVAVAMAGHWTDTDFSFGRTMSKEQDPDRIAYKMKELEPGMFEKFFSKPFYLYEVDGAGFHEDPAIQDFEVICNHSVKIVDEQKIDDPIEYLQASKMVKITFA